MQKNLEYIHTGAVGALVTCEIRGKRCVILQKRRQSDSFPGCLQVTVHGGLEGKNRKERETMIQALQREVAEEIGEMIARSSLGPGSINIKQFSSLEPRSCKILTVSRKTRFPKEDAASPTRKTDVTLGIDITDLPECLPQIETLAKDGVIVLLSADEINSLVPLNAEIHKANGVTETGKYGMFADEIEAVKKALGMKE